MELRSKRRLSGPSLPAHVIEVEQVPDISMDKEDEFVSDAGPEIIASSRDAKEVLDLNVAPDVDDSSGFHYEIGASSRKRKKTHVRERESTQESNGSLEGDFDVYTEMENLSDAPDVDDSSDDDQIEYSVRNKLKKLLRKKEKRPKKQRKKNKERNDRQMNADVLAIEKFEGISGFEFVDPIAMKKLLKEKKKKGEFRPMYMWDIWEEHKRWIDHFMSNKLNLDPKNEMMDETSREPAGLLARLLRFQKEWLSWALKQEESAVKGGILADEMGMGKTVQAIALVLAKRENPRTNNGADKSMSAPSPSSMSPELNCTLVICPASALHQWQREIIRFTQEGSIKVLCYQGTKRVKDSLHFFGYDFIITTYNTIEADYRKVLPPKQKCRWCGRSFHERRVAVHLKYYCGPQALKTDKQSKQDGKKKKHHLNVMLTQGKNDLGEKVHKGKRGEGRSGNNPQTEYGEEDLDDFEVDVRKSPLHSVKWERIILDEAHCIKDRRCNTARAVLVLESSYKWALSGTPLQNCVGELYSLDTQTGRIIGHGTERDGLYYLDEVTRTGQGMLTQVTSEDQIWMWYRRSAFYKLFLIPITSARIVIVGHLITVFREIARTVNIKPSDIFVGGTRFVSY